MGLCCALALTACSGSTPSASGRIVLSPLPAQLVRETPAPVSLPAAPVSRAQTEQLWARDRSALAACRIEKGALVAHYDQLSALLRGVK